MQPLPVLTGAPDPHAEIHIFQNILLEEDPAENFPVNLEHFRRLLLISCNEQVSIVIRNDPVQI